MVVTLCTFENVKTPLQLTLFWITLQRLQHDDLNSFSDSASSAASLRRLHNCQEQLIPVRLMCRSITVYKISFSCQHVKCLALMFVVCTDFE